MNIRETHLESLERLGYTDEEARFLYIVATHSGYFVARQFLGFAGAHWGKRTTLFWNKLERLKHVRIERFPKTGVIYHLFSRRLYRQIERENIRNRRKHEIDFVKRRIAILDFVLLHQGYQYLETEPEKVDFFCGELSVPQHFLPSRIYLGRPSSDPTVRRFVDKFPMFRCPSSPVVTFTYVDEGGASFADFTRHLEDYLPLFRQLETLRLIYLSRTASYFEKAAEVFDSLVKIPLESDVAENVVRYFQVRKAWDEKQYASLSDGDLIFRNSARSRFRAERFERLYRLWKSGRLDEGAIRTQFPSSGRRTVVHFEAQLLPRVSPAAALSEGER